jgi:hypothetical protein
VCSTGEVLLSYLSATHLTHYAPPTNSCEAHTWSARSFFWLRYFCHHTAEYTATYLVVQSSAYSPGLPLRIDEARAEEIFCQTASLLGCSNNVRELIFFWLREADRQWCTPLVAPLRLYPSSYPSAALHQSWASLSSLLCCG